MNHNWQMLVYYVILNPMQRTEAMLTGKVKMFFERWFYIAEKEKDDENICLTGSGNVAVD